jgi:hypothetical protein
MGYTMAQLHIKSGTTWAEIYARCRIEVWNPSLMPSLRNPDRRRLASAGESGALTARPLTAH